MARIGISPTSFRMPGRQVVAAPSMIRSKAGTAHRQRRFHPARSRAVQAGPTWLNNCSGGGRARVPQSDVPLRVAPLRSPAPHVKEIHLDVCALVRESEGGTRDNTPLAEHQDGRTPRADEDHRGALRFVARTRRSSSSNIPFILDADREGPSSPRRSAGTMSRHRRLPAGVNIAPRAISTAYAEAARKMVESPAGTRIQAGSTSKRLATTSCELTIPPTESTSAAGDAW